MGKIGNNLEYVISEIILRQLKLQDIDRVYIDFELEKDKFLEDFFCSDGEDIAYFKACCIVERKYHFYDFDELEKQDKEQYDRIYGEVQVLKEKKDEEVKAEARELLEKLIEQGKIISTVKKTKDDEKIRVYINGESYDYPNPNVGSLSLVDRAYNLFDNELDLLADQIYNTYRDRRCKDVPIKDRINILQKWFPEYSSIIEEIMNKKGCKEMETWVIRYFLGEAERQINKHTASEIGKGVEKGLSKEEEEAAKEALIRAKERETKTADEQDLN